MIITRSPLRISLGGGGTDLPSYYNKHEGFLLSAAIDKYVYISVSNTFANHFFLKYSEIEKVSNIDEIQHRIIKATLKHLNYGDSFIEITSTADMPAGTGLGSSGSFTTALIKALKTYSNQHINQDQLAEMACYIEMNLLNEPIGKQDQYIAALGGITAFAYHKDDSVTAFPLNISNEVVHELEDNLLLFFTGFSRNASDILRDQKIKSEKDDKAMEDNLHFIKEIGYKSKDFIEKGELESFGKLMHEHWLMKKKRSPGMSNEVIDDLYEFAMKNGAVGGKVVGAGGGGFLLFYSNQPKKLREAMKKKGYIDTRFSFDFDGTKTIHN